jgi:DNA-binding MarR family transcriptional regulator
VVQRLAHLLPPDPKGEFPFEVEEYVLQALHRMARVREGQFEAVLAPLGLSVSRYRALVAVVRAGRCTISDLATLIAYDRTTLVRVVTQLVRAGLLQRDAIKGDRRAVALTATEQGKAVFAQTVEHAERLNDQLFESVGEVRVRDMMRTLETMLRNIGASPDDIAGSLSRHWS